MLMLCAAMIDDEKEQSRFEQIYYSYRKQMLLVADRVLHNLDEAEDAVQNALFGIARNIKNVPQGESVERAYVLTAAKNAAFLLLPKQQQRDATLDITDLNISSKDDLLQQVVNSLDYDLLLRAMRKLDPAYRDVLMLVYVQEQSMDAVADILQRKKETVRKQLQRGKKKLIELCREEGMNFGQETV